MKIEKIGCVGSDESKDAYFWLTLAAYGERTALVDCAGTTLSYGELARRADQFASLPRGSLVLLALDNSIPSVIAYIGALRLGLPCIIVNKGDDEACDRIVSHFAPDAQWCTSRGLRLCSDRTPRRPIHDELAVLLSTSGSTGSTKLVKLSAQAIDANARSIVECLEISSAERAITTLPPGYSYGLSVINSHLAAGASTILYSGSVASPDFRSLVEAAKATSLAGVPYTYELLQRTGFLDRLPTSVKMLTQAGGRLPPDHATRVALQMQRAGGRFYVMYGQTEATARMAYLPPEALLNCPDAIGRAVPGGSFELIDPETGATVADRGELVYRGPNVMMGYANSRSDLSKGYEIETLHTGDIAERVSPELYRIVGRTSRFLKICGIRISLDDIERDLAAKGASAVATGDDGLLVVAVTSAATANIARVRLQEVLSLPSHSTVVLNLPEVHRLASGKVDYAALMIAGQKEICLATVSNATPEVCTNELLRKAFCDALRIDSVDSLDTFQHLNGDSLSYIQVSMAIEGALGHLPDDWEQLSIGKLEAMAATEPPKVVGRQFRWVSSEMLLRPVAVALIVLVHAIGDLGNEGLAGGALVLLLLAGYNLHQFHSESLNDGRLRIIQNLFAKIVLPYYAILAVYFALTPNQFGVQTFVLANNVWRDPGVTTMVSFWFIQTFVQCVLVFVGLFCIPKIRKLYAARPLQFSYFLLFLAILLKTIFGQQQLSSSNTSYSTQDWAFVFILGWIISQSDTFLKRCIALATTYITVAFDWGLTDSHSLFALATAAALLFVHRLQIASQIAAVFAFLGNISFFVYLTQGIAINAIKIKMGIESSMLMLLTAGLFGYFMYATWKISANVFRNLLPTVLRQVTRLWPRNVGAPYIKKPSVVANVGHKETLFRSELAAPLIGSGNTPLNIQSRPK